MLPDPMRVVSAVVCLIYGLAGRVPRRSAKMFMPWTGRRRIEPVPAELGPLDREGLSSPSLYVLARLS